MSDTHRHFQLQWRGARNNTGTEGTQSTHVLVRNDMGDVLQDQLSPPAVLVKFLEEHPRLEIPSGERQTDVVTKTWKVFLVQGWQCRACGRVWLPSTFGNLMGYIHTCSSLCAWSVAVLVAPQQREWLGPRLSGPQSPARQSLRGPALLSELQPFPEIPQVTDGNVDMLLSSVSVTGLPSPPPHT